MPRPSLLLPLALLACAAPAPRSAHDTAAPAESLEASVKPGINDSFLDPDLDVDRFLERFEVESREIFAERHGITAALGLGPGDRVADVGAGTGLFLEFFSQAVGPTGQVYAVEIAPPFVEHLTARADALDLDNVEAHLCSERSVELPPGSVDVVFVCDTYHHFEYPRSTSGSIHDALAPGGELFVVDFERIPGVSSEWILGHVRAGKLEVIAELNAFGFDLVEALDIDGLEENYALRFRKR